MNKDQVMAQVHARIKRTPLLTAMLRPVGKVYFKWSPLAWSLLRGQRPLRLDTSTTVGIDQAANSSQLVVGERQVDRTAPLCVGELPEVYAGPITSKFAPLKIHELSEALVVGQVAVFDANGAMVEEISRTAAGGLGADGRTVESVELSSWIAKPIRLDGVTALCTDFDGMGYWHWMMEVNTKLGLLQHGGWKPEKIDHYIVNSTMTRFQQDSMERWGIPKHKIVESLSSPSIRAERLLVPDHLGDTRNPHPFSFEALGEMLGRATSQGTRRLYVSRQQTSHRRITNHRQLLEMLEQFGFQEVIAEDLSLAEKADLFSQAEVVAGATGAGFTHIAHCAPGTKILEFVRDYVGDTWFWSASSALGLAYAMVRISNDDRSKISSDDVTVPIADVEATLALLGVDRRPPHV